jgi:hypothetical protein
MLISYVIKVRVFTKEEFLKVFKPITFWKGLKKDFRSSIFLEKIIK